MKTMKNFLLICATDKVSNVLCFRRFGVPMYTLPPPKTTNTEIYEHFPVPQEKFLVLQKEDKKWNTNPI